MPYAFIWLVARSKAYQKTIHERLMPLDRWQQKSYIRDRVKTFTCPLERLERGWPHGITASLSLTWPATPLDRHALSPAAAVST